MIAIFLQGWLSIYIMYLLSDVLAVGVGCFLLVTRAITEFQNILIFINEHAKIKTEREQTTERIMAFIEFHAILKQLVRSRMIDENRVTSFSILFLYLQIDQRFFEPFSTNIYDCFCLEYTHYMWFNDNGSH